MPLSASAAWTQCWGSRWTQRSVFSLLPNRSPAFSLGEAIAEAVLRQLRRMRQQAPEDVGLSFDTGAVPVQVQRWAYAGDAVACQQYLPAAASRLRVGCALSSEPLDLPLATVDASPDRLALLGLARYSAASGEEARRARAVRYHLLTEYTSAILVKRRAEGEQFEVLPQIRPQAKMLGRGMVSAVPAPPSMKVKLVACARRAPAADDDVDYFLGVPDLARRADVGEPEPRNLKSLLSHHSQSRRCETRR